MEKKEREWINDTVNELRATADRLSGADRGTGQTNGQQTRNAEDLHGSDKKSWQTNVRAWWRAKRSRKRKAQTGDQA